MIELAPALQQEIDPRITLSRDHRQPPLRLGITRLDAMLQPWDVTSIRRLDLGDGVWPNRRSFLKIRFAPGRRSVTSLASELSKRPDLVMSVDRNTHRAVGGVPATDADARWAFSCLRVEEAWKLGALGSGVRVAILDTGCAMAHHAFSGAWPEQEPCADFVDVRPEDAPDGWHWAGDTRGRDDDASDDVGHGTHVAGIVGARDVGRAIGVAPEAMLICARVLGRLEHDMNGTAIGFGTAFDVAAGTTGQHATAPK